MITAHHLVFGRKYSTSSGNYYLNDVLQQSTVNGKVFLVSGPKNNIPAYQFGLGNIVTQLLPISSVWSISFWLKTNSTSLTNIIAELSSNFNNKDGFLVGLSDTSSILGKLMSGISNATSQNLKNTNDILNDGIWRHIVIVLDRNESLINEIKIYINSFLKQNIIYLGGDEEMSGNFMSDKIYFGGRGNSYQYPFNGLSSIPKFYNRALTQTEITNLYNE